MCTLVFRLLMFAVLWINIHHQIPSIWDYLDISTYAIYRIQHYKSVQILNPSNLNPSYEKHAHNGT